VRTAAAAGVAAVTVVVAAVLGSPAAAATSTVSCSERGGTIEGERIVGDLVVDGTCVVSRVAVTGTLRISQTGDLVARSSAFKGDVLTAGRAYLDGSVVMGGVVVTDPASASYSTVYLVDSTVRHSVRGHAWNVALERATVEGAITVTARLASKVQDSTVGGWVTLSGGWHELYGSDLARGFTSRDSAGINVCESAVTLDLTVLDAQDYVDVGRFWASSPGDRCGVYGYPGPTSVGGSLALLDVPNPILLDRVEVAGDLRCTGATGLGGLEMTDVVVAGQRTGRCAAGS
jgi:cytoskeletal protein CcmA (bactofilin family)